MNVCAKHGYDEAEGTCQICHDTYCASCLVYPKGPSKPPLCIECALARAGVRPRVKHNTRMAQKSYTRTMLG